MQQTLMPGMLHALTVLFLTFLHGMFCSVMQAAQGVEVERKLASEQQLQQKQASKAEMSAAHLPPTFCNWHVY